MTEMKDLVNIMMIKGGVKSMPFLKNPHSRKPKKLFGIISDVAKPKEEENKYAELNFIDPAMRPLAMIAIGEPALLVEIMEQKEFVKLENTIINVATRKAMARR